MNVKFLLPLVLAAALALPACSNIPSSQAINAATAAETALVVTETAITIQYANGKISLAQYKQLQILDQVAFNYLTALQTAAAAGDTVTANQQLALFNQALAQFNAAYAASKGVVLPVPSTQP